jgi:hypothetical protein
MSVWEELAHDEEADDAAEDVVASLDEEVTQDDLEDDSSLESDVQRRLEVASLYKTLLSDSFFTKDSEAARIVTKRLRRFVTAELKALLGMGAPPQAESAFTPAQTDALRRIADKVLEKDGLSPATTTPASPQPALRQVEQPREVALRKRSVPATAPMAKAEPAPKPAARPVAQVAKPSPKTTTKGGPVGPTKAKVKVTQVNKDAGDGEKKIFRKEEVTENNRLVQKYIDEKGRPLGSESVAVRDVTPQVRPPDALPMPSPHHIGTIMESQSLNTAEISGERLGSIMTPQRRIVG